MERLKEGGEETMSRQGEYGTRGDESRVRIGDNL